MFQIYYSNFFHSYGDYHDNQTPKNHNIAQYSQLMHEVEHENEYEKVNVIESLPFYKHARGV